LLKLLISTKNKLIGLTIGCDIKNDIGVANEILVKFVVNCDGVKRTMIVSCCVETLNMHLYNLTFSCLKYTYYNEMFLPLQLQR
jgi:hypothetical protein